jgi:hypothetical protein
MFEIGVGRKKRAEARAGREWPGIVVASILADQRQHFVCYVAIKSGQQFRLQMRWHLLIEQTVAVDTVNRVSPNPAAVDMWTDGVHQMKTLILEIVSCRSGEHQ